MAAAFRVLVRVAALMVASSAVPSANPTKVPTHAPTATAVARNTSQTAPHISAAPSDAPPLFETYVPADYVASDRVHALHGFARCQKSSCRADDFDPKDSEEYGGWWSGLIVLGRPHSKPLLRR